MGEIKEGKLLLIVKAVSVFLVLAFSMAVFFNSSGNSKTATFQVADKSNNIIYENINFD